MLVIGSFTRAILKTFCAISWLPSASENASGYDVKLVRVFGALVKKSAKQNCMSNLTCKLTFLHQ